MNQFPAPFLEEKCFIEAALEAGEKFGKNPKFSNYPIFGTFGMENFQKNSNLK
jgi:hypothetical protein